MIFCFDCFGTIFDASTILQEDIKKYVHHVNKPGAFEKFDFPQSFWDLGAHPDSMMGIEMLRNAGHYCITLSNGSINLLKYLSSKNGIIWDGYTDLEAWRVYKPSLDAYKVVEKQFGYKPADCVMVTANCTFGDIEGAENIGMEAYCIRGNTPYKDLIDFAHYIISL
jgi:2-haloalkanoic acid dehalogenase type II